MLLVLCAGAVVWYVNADLFCSVGKAEIARYYEPIVSTPLSDVTILSAHDYSVYGECFDFEITSSQPLVLRLNGLSPESVPADGVLSLGMPSGPIKRACPWIATHFHIGLNDIYFDASRKHCLVKGKGHWFHDGTVAR